MNERSPDARATPRAFSFAVLIFALAYGGAQLWNQLAEGRTSWAAESAVALAAVLAIVLGVAAVRRASALELAFGGLAWAFCAAVVSVLPAYATAETAGSGPSQAPVYAALALLTGLFAVGALPGLALPAPLRGAFLVVFWATADGHAFQRNDETAVPLIAGAALLLLAARPRVDPGACCAGLPAKVFAVAALLVGWWTVAVPFGDSWRRGTAAVGYLASGVAIAAALATVLDGRAASTAVRATLAALLACFALLVAAVSEMWPYNDLVRIAGSRLHLFVEHPNQIAPLFAIGAAVAAPLALRPGREPATLRIPRWVFVLALASCAVLIAWTRSRGSTLALVVGAVAACAAAAGRLPRRPARLVVGAALLAAVAVALLLSPLGEPLRGWIAERAQVQSAVGQRYHLWRSATAAIADHPWAGLGPAQYYAHAAYAEPSFLDGNVQDIHPHSILLAAAECAGLPGLLLFAALVLGVLELGRRRVLAAADAGERRLLACLFGAAVAVLVADLADLSQSGLTLMPLTVWIALGVFAAPTDGATAVVAESRGRPRRRALVCAALFLPLCAMPLVGEVVVRRAHVEADDGQPWRAVRWYRLLLAGVHPWNAKAPMGIVTAEQQNGHPERALELLDAARRETPGRLMGWLIEGEMLLDAGRPEEARDLLERARSIDPYGKHAGRLTMLRVRALLELGERARARGLLLEALAEPGSPWAELPRVPLPSQPDDPPGAARFGLQVGGDPPGVLPFGELLDVLERQLFDELDEDPVHARRLVGPIVEGWRAQGLPGVALDVLERYRERTPAMASIQVLELELLAELGDYDGVARVYHQSEYIDHPYMRAAFLRCIRGSEDPEHRREFRELPLVFGASKLTDLSFSAELSSEVYALQAERALARGEGVAAKAGLERALYHLDSPPARLATAAAYFERAVELGAGEGLLRDALATLLREAGRMPAVARDGARMDRWARELAGVWGAGELDGVLHSAGRAGRTFAAAWHRAGR